MIIWYGPPYSYSGYGLHNRKLVLELDRMGFDIKLIPTEEHIPEELPEREALLKLTRKKLKNHDKIISINCIPPPSSAHRSDYSILYTTLESETVHWGAKVRATYFNEIWIPCKQNYKAYRKAGFSRRKLFIMPEGVNPVFHSPAQGILKEHKSDDFTFLYIGDWSYRKGIQQLLIAFSYCFATNENVRLLLKTNYQGHNEEKSEKRILMEFEHMKKIHAINSAPHVDFIFPYLSEQNLSKLYNSVDCYISPSLGEAWNLPVMQAMAHKLPVITTKYGGPTDYCNKKNAFLIQIDKMDRIDDKTTVHVDFYQGVNFAFPNISHLVNLMRYVFEHKEEAKKKGIQARQDCINKWTWKLSAKKIAKRLERIRKKL